MTAAEHITIQPQPGFQTEFLASAADIVIGGGAAGAGKTFALLMEPVRHVQDNGDFGAVIFRRTYPQIENEGGLWDTSISIYPFLGAKQNENAMEWRFPSGARIKFSHLQHEKNVFDWQGSQIPFIGFDELTHFTEKMFFYMLSRNRSTCGVDPYVRATCNPDPDSWVARLIAWWIDEQGWPIPERAGVIRYFTRDNDAMVWGDTVADVIKKIPHLIAELPKGTTPETLVKSMTFIPGTIYENAELMAKNPAYLGSLLAQDEATKTQLLKGNWKIKPSSESLIQWPAMLDTFTNAHVKDGRRYITADIALHGSDMFVAFVWSGMRVIDAVVLPKTDGKTIERLILDLCKRYSVQQSHVVYDADGVGGYLGGYLANAVSFNNGASPVKNAVNGSNYRNLKTQCFYLLAERINAGDIAVTENVANMKVDGRRLADLISKESTAVKRNNPDADGKMAIIPKEQMKNILGHSPDYMDAMMMRMWFELRPAAYAAPRILKTA